MNRAPNASLAASLLGSSGALALFLLAAGASAETPCAGPQDVSALRTAAIQQYLMVAALTCNAAAAYNGFVISHQGELQESDKALLSFFHRLDANTGDDAYNTYKTSLANVASLRSLHDLQFCHGADVAFGAALGRTLAEFVSQQPLPINLVYTSCTPSEPDAPGPVDAGLGSPTQRQALLGGR